MMLRARLALAALPLFALLASSSFASAQDAKADAAKAKATATENLKRIKIAKPTIVETDNFIIAGSMPEAKAKALGAMLEKTLTVARKAAKFDAKESPWKGKLIVYYLPDVDDYKSYKRLVLQKDHDGVYVDLRSDPAFVVDPVELPGKPTDAELHAHTAARIAGELLKAKGTGTQVIPEWLRDGFGRVCVMRAEGTTSKRYQAYKREARAAILFPKNGMYPSLSDAMSSEKSATAEVLANSLSEFLAFGTKAAEFDKFIEAMRPADGNQNPTPQAGFSALGWKDDKMTDLAWKRWVQTGR